MGPPPTETTGENRAVQPEILTSEQEHNQLGVFVTLEEDSSDDIEVTVNEICNNFGTDLCVSAKAEDEMVHSTSKQSQPTAWSDGDVNSSKSDIRTVDESDILPKVETTRTAQGLHNSSEDTPVEVPTEHCSQVNFIQDHLNINRSAYDYTEKDSGLMQNNEYLKNDSNMHFGKYQQPLPQTNLQAAEQPNYDQHGQNWNMPYTRCTPCQNGGMNKPALSHCEQNAPANLGPAIACNTTDFNCQNNCLSPNAHHIPSQLYVFGQFVNQENTSEDQNFTKNPVYEYGSDVKTASAVTPSGQKLFIPIDNDKYEVRKHEDPGEGEVSSTRVTSPRPVQFLGSLSDDEGASDVHSCSSGISILSSGTAASYGSYDSAGYVSLGPTVHSNGVISMHSEGNGQLYSSNVILPEIAYTPNNFQQHYPIQMKPEEFFQAFNAVPVQSPTLSNICQPQLQAVSFNSDCAHPVNNSALCQVSSSRSDLSQCSVMPSLTNNSTIMPLSQTNIPSTEQASWVAQPLQTNMVASQPVNNAPPYNYVMTHAPMPPPVYPNMNYGIQPNIHQAVPCITSPGPVSDITSCVPAPNCQQSMCTNGQVVDYAHPASSGDPISLSSPEVYTDGAISKAEGTSKCIPLISSLIDPNDGLAYPALHISDESVITVLLRHDVSLEMTTEKSLRLAHHKDDLVVAIDEDGASVYLSHPAGKIYQNRSVTDVDIFYNRRAKLTADAVEFANDSRSFKIVNNVVNLQSVKRGHFRDLDEDESLNFIMPNQKFFDCDLRAKCNDIAVGAYFETQPKNGCKVVINGIKVVQNDRGDVCVFCGPVNYLRMSPSTGNLRVKTNTMDVDVDPYWNIRLRQGQNVFKASRLGMVLENENVEMNLSRDGRFAAFSLPDRRRLMVGQRPPRWRPGVPRPPRFRQFRR